MIRGAYYKSPGWKATRKRRLEEGACLCEDCKRPLTGPKEVHHNNYDTIGHEGWSDLDPMHERCHARKHHRSPKSYHTIR